LAICRGASGGREGSGFDGADADAEGFGGFTGGDLSDFRELHDGLENGAELIDSAGETFCISFWP